MSIKDYKITGTYQYNDHLINITVAKIVGTDEKTAYKIAENHDMGDLSYEPSTNKFFFVVNGLRATERADLSSVNYCEEFSPRPGVQHELFMGSPLYQSEDYKKVSLHAIEEYLDKKFHGNTTDKVIIFNNLSYGISEIIDSGIEWKEIRSCDVCEAYGFVRENIDNQGQNIMHSCYFDCGDTRNIPTLENSMCEYCRVNKATKEFCYKGNTHSGFYCDRCELELTDLYKEHEEEKKLEAIEYKRYVEEYGEVDTEESIELFFNDPSIYGSYMNYLKCKKNALDKGIEFI